MSVFKAIRAAMEAASCAGAMTEEAFLVAMAREGWKIERVQPATGGRMGFNAAGERVPVPGG